jgi:hypothetical protein
MLTKMQKLATELVEVRGKLSELDDTYKELKTPWEEARDYPASPLRGNAESTDALYPLRRLHH